MEKSLKSMNSQRKEGENEVSNVSSLETRSKAGEGNKQRDIPVKNADNHADRPTILIAIISNTPTYPDYFADSLMNLHIHTSKFARSHIRRFRACSVNHMRNMACRFALGHNPEGIKYDYICMLDQDHKYPADFIEKFLKHDLDFVCGSTNMRKLPFTPTQYKKVDCSPISAPNNAISAKGKDSGLELIEASGMVGALIKTSVLEKLDYPYFHMTYRKDGTATGGDLNFSKKMKKAGIKMYLDYSVSFPHEVRMFIDRDDFVVLD